MAPQIEREQKKSGFWNDIIPLLTSEVVVEKPSKSHNFLDIDLEKPSKWYLLGFTKSLCNILGFTKLHMGLAWFHYAY